MRGLGGLGASRAPTHVLLFVRSVAALALEWFLQVPQIALVAEEDPAIVAELEAEVKAAEKKRVKDAKRAEKAAAAAEKKKFDDLTEANTKLRGLNDKLRDGNKNLAEIVRTQDQEIKELKKVKEKVEGELAKAKERVGALKKDVQDLRAQAVLTICAASCW